MQHTAIIRQRYGQHPRLIEGPYIVWLPATTGVEGRLIEHHHRVAVLDKIVHHPGGKLRQPGIVPVEFGGHSVFRLFLPQDSEWAPSGALPSGERSSTSAHAASAGDNGGMR